ncbi:MAG: GNAT family N-acetyltransferase [Armatimonadetes bacterium]|nr:GNAT family N-acetyltransferase [Armatimonadota bacterium]
MSQARRFLSTAGFDRPAVSTAFEPIFVRPARQADRRTIGALVAIGFPDKFAPIFGRNGEQTARLLAELPSSGTVYVAEHGGVIAGTATLTMSTSAPPPPLWPVLRRHLPFWRALRAFLLLLSMGAAGPASRTAMIEAVVVRPDARGAGVGRALMRTLLEDAERAGREEAALYVVEGNDAAIRLYESIGFAMRRRQAVGIYRGIFGARHLLYMTRRLGPGAPLTR